MNDKLESSGEQSDVDYLAFWGKAQKCDSNDIQKSCPEWHPAAFHCLDVAAVSQVILDQHHGIRNSISELLGIDTEHAVPIIRFLICLHDIGKFAKRFQSKVPALYPKCFDDEPSKLPRGYNHSSGGYRLFDAMSDVFRLPKNTTWTAWDSLVSAVTGHHGSPPDVEFGSTNLPKIPFGLPGIAAADAFAREALKIFPISCDFPEINGNCAKRASFALAGLTTLSDWIGSDRKWFPYCQSEEFGSLSDYWSYSIEHAKQAVDAKGILPAGPATGLTYDDLIGSDGIPSPMQKWAQSVEIPSGPSLFIIEDETGSGKTEAALMLAHRLMVAKRADGLYFALPTMATANAMFDRIGCAKRLLFRPNSFPSTVLAHGARDLHNRFRNLSTVWDRTETRDLNDLEAGAGDDDETASKACADWVSDDRRLAFLADAGAGTVDQALLAILPSRYQALRLIGLMRRVLILDEVHAYDAYMNQEIRTLLEFQAGLGGCAIILSATLPLSVRDQLASAFSRGLGEQHEIGRLLTSASEYPSASVVTSGQAECVAVNARAGQARKLPIHFLRTMGVGLDIVEEAYRERKAVLYIRNTVDDAFEAWEELRTKRNIPATIFHARFALGDRLGIEERITKKFGKTSTPPDRAGVLISTQVVEQSLDLDFDSMVSDLAPIDLLVQRAGRLWRHGHRRDRTGTPVLNVVGPDPREEVDENWFARAFHRAAWVYRDHARLFLTAKMLMEKGAIVSPAGLRGLLEAVYGDDVLDDVPVGLQSGFFEAEGRSGAERGAANAGVLKFREGYVRGVHWDSDHRIPVRINDDPAVTLRLARTREGRVEPLCLSAAPNDVRIAWRLSELNIAARLVSGAFIPPELSEAVRQAKEEWTRYDSDKIMVVLNDTGLGTDGRLRGRAMHGSGEVDILYDSDGGLRIEPK